MGATTHRSYARPREDTGNADGAAMGAALEQRAGVRILRVRDGWILTNDMHDHKTNMRRV